MSESHKPGRALKGFCDRLVRELQAKGYQYDVAHQAVAAVFERMKRALARREPVEIPGLGWLVVIPVKTRRCWRLGRIVDIPKYPFRIELLKKLPGQRRRRRPGPGKNLSQRPSPLSLPSHPPRIAVKPHPNRSEVPSRTRGIKPGNR